MKVDSIQNKVFKALLDHKNVRYGNIDDKTIYVTYDGYTAYVLDKNDVMFDLNKCQLMPDNDLFDESKYVPVKMGENLKIDRFGKKVMRELVGDFGSVFVDNSLFSVFSLPEIYGKSKYDPVLIKEYGRLAGIIMPVKYNPIMD